MTNGLEECLRSASQYRFEISVIHDIRARLRRIALPRDLMTRIKLRLARLRVATAPGKTKSSGRLAATRR